MSDIPAEFADFELSRPLAVDDLPEVGERHFKINASDEECQALAQRFDLLGLSNVNAHLRARRLRGTKNAISLKGEFSADVIQACVVTLAPVATHIEGEIDRVYGNPREIDVKEFEIPEDDSDLPDPVIDGMIDMGEAIAEEICLELPPFPKAAGTEFENYGVGPEISEEEEKKDSPFASLADFKKKLS